MDADLRFDWFLWFQEEEIEKMRGLSELNKQLLEENESYKQVMSCIHYLKGPPKYFFLGYKLNKIRFNQEVLN